MRSPASMIISVWSTSSTHSGRLNLPSVVAIALLYLFAVLQIIVGALFAAIVLFRSTPAVLHRLSFKASIMIFALFCAGDILLGDRI
jgi:hypothetical protein